MAVVRLADEGVRPIVTRSWSTVVAGFRVKGSGFGILGLVLRV
jgi:hypothetical protein